MLFSSCGQYIPAWGSGVKAKPLWGRYASLDPASRPGFLAAKRKTTELKQRMELGLVGTARDRSLVLSDRV